MKKLIFLFALMLCLISTYTQAQTTNKVWSVTAYNDTLTNADSAIYYLPALPAGSFPAGCEVVFTVYTKAVSGTTTALVLYPEYTDFDNTAAKYARDYSSQDTLQIHTGTFYQLSGPYTVRAQRMRVIIKQTGTAVRITGLAATIRKRPGY